MNDSNILEEIKRLKAIADIGLLYSNNEYETNSGISSLFMRILGRYHHYIYSSTDWGSEAIFLRYFLSLK